MVAMLLTAMFPVIVFVPGVSVMVALSMVHPSFGVPIGEIGPCPLMDMVYSWNVVWHPEPILFCWLNVQLDRLVAL